MTPADPPRSADDDVDLKRVWRPSWPCPVGQVLAAYRRGGGDPTFHVDPDGTRYRALLTPEGPATLAIARRSGAGEVRGTAWGPGAAWALEQLPAMLGAEDDPSTFEPHHTVIADAWRDHPHWRVPRSGLVLDALVPAVIEQKVTGKEAFTGWRRLVRQYGEPAPGPAARERRLLLPPAPEVLRMIPSWDWAAMHIDPNRARIIVQVATRAAALERLALLPPAEADRKLRSLPGIGVWTSAEVRSRAFGDADAVSFGDYHVAKDIGWALTGTPLDDAGLEVLLEPYRGHRLRVQVLVGLAGLHRPRRGPRMSLPTHTPRPVR